MTRVLVVKLSSLGDIFHALPAVHAISLGLEAKVDWVVHDAYAACVSCFNDVGRVIPFYRRAFWSKLPVFLKDLRRENYDLTLDLQGNLKSVLVSRMARSKRLIGPSFHREGSRRFYPEIAGKPLRERHAVEQLLDTPRFLGLHTGEPVFPVSFPKPANAGPRPRVALIPFSRWPSKNWPAAGFIELARQLCADAGANIFLLGGREDESAAASMAQAMDCDAHNMAGRLSLVELGSMLSDMDLVIGNDTGPLHMAAAIGTTVLGIYGPTNPKRTGPYGAGHRVMTPPECACAPCYSRQCLRPENFCMSGITPKAVLEEALGMLQTKHR